MNDQRRLTRDPVHVFVGRDGELSELSAGLEDAIGGRGRLFLIEGEPGIGKTMLAEQLAIRASERGVRAVWGRCWEGGGAPAYWPWTQLLRSLVEQQTESPRTDGDAEIVDITRLVPELDEKSGAGPGPGLSTHPIAMRFRLFAAVAAILKRVSSIQP